MVDKHMNLIKKKFENAQNVLCTKYNVQNIKLSCNFKKCIGKDLLNFNRDICLK